MVERRQRVPALSPEERRAALIAATIPLLREHGASVSTRQIADAAGVAEGTIFGVFKDKASLLKAAVASALDPAPLLRGLKAVDPVLPLRRRLVAFDENANVPEIVTVCGHGYRLETPGSSVAQ